MPSRFTKVLEPRKYPSLVTFTNAASSEISTLLKRKMPDEFVVAFKVPSFTCALATGLFNSSTTLPCTLAMTVSSEGSIGRSPLNSFWQEKNSIDARKTSAKFLINGFLLKACTARCSDWLGKLKRKKGHLIP